MDWLKARQEILLLGLISLMSAAGFIAYGLSLGVAGFPLDDAWIHQTFARNLAQELTWSFQSGQLSGGSTGPLYGVILGGIHALGLPPVWGTHFLGFLTLWGCSLGGYLITKKLLPENDHGPLICGGVIALEWHLVWSSLSGMETLLLAGIAVSIFYILTSKDVNYWLAGLVIGISVWIRPDGVTLTGPVLLVLILLNEGGWKRKVHRLLWFVGSLAAVAVPYFLFNRVVAGDIWPNTFFAKQAEYASLRDASYLLRYGQLSQQIITGIGAVLLPGLIFELIDIVKRRDAVRGGMFAWMVGYIGIYAWRLPVVYQHGRYIMPAMPIFFILSVIGTFRLLRPFSKKNWVRISSRAAFGAAALVLVSFWLLGARAYGRDVGVIETEMVRVAEWVRSNTEESDLIGAHDIGALAYFGDREILDLAGLVTPDVIPFIRDQQRLALYLDQQKADFLVAFPGWYPDIVEGLEPVYQGGGEFTVLFGMDSLTVYKWESGH